MAYMRLGDLLINAGVLDNESLEKALELQKESKARLGDVLVEEKFISEEQLIDALQQQLGVDFVDLTSVNIPIDMAKFVPKNIARKNNVIPVKLVKNELYVAMSDPLNFYALEEIRTASRKNVIPMISTRVATEHAIAELYGNEGAARAIDEMIKEAGPDAFSVSQITEIQDDSSSAPTVRFVNSVIERSISEHASDIHLEPQENEMIVRMRIDGLLRKMLTVPASLQSTVISRIKIIGNMNISEHMVPQDGRANVTMKGRDIDLRISSLPTVFGEKIVIRLLDKSSDVLDKKSLGMDEDDIRKYDALLKNSSGAVLIVGPTGSGKSTTMYAMVNELAREEVNVVTLEDPVEYHINGVNQCQINEKTGMTFASGLRSILRQDPDVISVGEIRDGETGSIAMRAAITGHIVLSTLHTNDAVSAIDRLTDIGVEPYLTSSALRGVISQRLVRKVCPDCAKPYKPTAEQLAFFDLPEDSDVEFYKGEGCPKCFHTGNRGRMAVFEILTINKELRGLINSRASYEEVYEAACRSDFVSLKQSCLKHVLKGETTVEEAFRVVNSTEV